MTEVKTTDGKVLFYFDKSKTTLAKVIGGYGNLENADLKGANLVGADLRYSNLSDADLMGADLEGAKLYRADLKGADLRGANLKGADLSGANLSYADLFRADIRGANLQNADLFYANLFGADFSDADIEGADLRRAKNVPDLPLACPAEGKFIAWKKVDDDFLVKLEIPVDAKRSSATTKKCRCSKALVLDIECMWSGEHTKMVVNDNYRTCVYEVGKMVYPDSFDEDRWYECSHGIHFFMNKQDAIDY